MERQKKAQSLRYISLIMSNFDVVTLLKKQSVLIGAIMRFDFGLGYSILVFGTCGLHLSVSWLHQAFYSYL